MAPNILKRKGKNKKGQQFKYLNHSLDYISSIYLTIRYYVLNECLRI